MFCLKYKLILAVAIRAETNNFTVFTILCIPQCFLPKAVHFYCSAGTKHYIIYSLMILSLFRYNILLQCWELSPDNRPLFSVLACELTELLLPSEYVNIRDSGEYR